MGFESFTSEQVALRAGVPIGSLYQFFGNKYAIICELDRLDTVNVQAELEKFAAEIPSLDWAELLDKLLDHLAGLWRTDPSRRAVWLAMQATPPTRAIAAEHERDLAVAGDPHARAADARLEDQRPADRSPRCWCT